MNPLVILMTRMEGDSEWKDESLWGFGSNSFIAFIRQGSIQEFSADELTRELAKKQIQDDVWVINGSDFADYKEALDKIDWGRLGRKFILRIHLGEGRKVRSEYWQDKIRNYPENLRYFIDQADDYTLGKGLRFEPIIEFARAKESKSDEYNRALRKLQETLGISVPRIEYVIDLLQMFLPLDIDLQLVQFKSDDEDFGRCRNTAQSLLNSASEIVSLLSKITKEYVPPQRFELSGAEVPANSMEKDTGITTERSVEKGAGPAVSQLNPAVFLVSALLDMARKVHTVETREELLTIFGRTTSAMEKENGIENPILEEKGFHRTLERLRDTLLKLVEGD